PGRRRRSRPDRPCAPAGWWSRASPASVREPLSFGILLNRQAPHVWPQDAGRKGGLSAPRPRRQGEKGRRVLARGRRRPPFSGPHDRRFEGRSRIANGVPDVCISLHFLFGIGGFQRLAGDSTDPPLPSTARTITSSRAAGGGR